ncbi:MAG: DsrE/DsrF/DrsH-like family protein [Rhodospirillales bacterium]|nr:DsrE/DsrF/DrsH-like family protein [Rhodospirillales bacterium]
MSAKPLFILVCSEEHEKIQMAAMMASVAAVSETQVHVFISMGAIYPFKKGLSDDQRYKGGRFSQVLKDKKAPDAMMLFEQGKELGDMTMHACSMALDVLGWEEDELIEGLFDGCLGLTKFLSDAESGELITL